jgi:hypothetical protein
LFAKKPLLIVGFWSVFHCTPYAEFVELAYAATSAFQFAKEFFAAAIPAEHVELNTPCPIMALMTKAAPQVSCASPFDELRFV